MYEVKIFCQNVKTLRKLYGYPKVKMAKILGIGVKSLSLIESGVIPPKLKCDVLVRIANAFGISPSSMFKEINF